MRVSLLFSLLLFCFFSNAQFITDKADSSQLTIAGYLQPQYQVASKEGVRNYSGGDFNQHSDNRFMLRRSCIKFDFLKKNYDHAPSLQLVFQVDATEKGVYARDMWLKYFENKYHLFSLTAGIFSRLFGNEVTFSSAKRESPERGRMSQILMKTERAMGAMISFEPQGKDHPLRYFKVDAGLFNGQGLTAPGDYDSHKDFITRIAIKPYPI